MKYNTIWIHAKDTVQPLVKAGINVPEALLRRLPRCGVLLFSASSLMPTRLFDLVRGCGMF